MRILLANGTAYPQIGGVENSLQYIARELRRTGHEVLIFCLQYSSDEPPSMIHEGTEIVRAPYRQSRLPYVQLPRRTRAVQKAVPAVVRKFRPDAVWCRSASVGLGLRRGGYQGPLIQIVPTSAKMNTLGAFVRTHRLPLARRLMLAGLGSLTYLVSAYQERELLQQCRAVAFSENMCQQLRRAWPDHAGDCKIIRPGVDGEIFSPENGASFFPQLRDEYGLSSSDSIVLYVGRLSCAKNIPLLMDAVSFLNKRVKLVLVGSGSEQNRLMSYARRIRLSNRVVFAGIQRKMLPGFYALSRVMVMPTTIESFGQAYLEAMASGTLAVGFAGDGRRILTATEEIIREGITGGVVKEVSAQALAERIDSILSLDDDAYASMSQRARRDVLDRFSWRRFVAEALELSCSLDVEREGEPRT